MIYRVKYIQKKNSINVMSFSGTHKKFPELGTFYILKHNYLVINIKLHETNHKNNKYSYYYI